MKQKKQTKSILFIIVSSIVIGIFMTLSLKSEAAPAYNSPMWKNTLTEEISEEYSFTPRFTSDSEVIDSKGLLGTSSLYDPARRYDNSIKGKYVIVSNTGFYKGHSVTTRFDFSSTKTTSYDWDAIYLTPRGLFSLYAGNPGSYYTNQSLYGTFSFFDEKGNPIKVSGHIPYSNIETSMPLTVSKAAVKNIYTLPKDYFSGEFSNSPQEGGLVDIREINGGNDYQFSLISKAEWPRNFHNHPSRTVVTTFENVHTFSISSRATSENTSTGMAMRTGYGDLIPLIRMNAPRGRDTDYQEINNNNHDELYMRFTQDIPFQSKNNRYKSATWKLNGLTNSDIFDIKWRVFSNLDGELTDKFIVEEDGSLRTDSFDENVFYDTELEFRAYLVFNGKEVDINQLNAEGELVMNTVPELYLSNGPYNGQKVTAGAEYSPMKTTINMKSTVKTNYLEQSGGGTLRKQRNLLMYITQKVPMSEPFEDYYFVRATPTDMNNYQIRYTNEVEMRYYSSGLPYITEHLKWKNSLDRVVSNQFSFVMAATEFTKIKDYSNGILIDEKSGGNIPFDASKAQYIVFENAGYCNLEPITVRLDINPKVKTGKDKKNFIVSEGNSFLSVSSNLNTQGLDLKYSFYDVKGNPIKVSGIVPIAGVSGSDKVTFDSEIIKEIGSVNRQFNNNGTSIHFMQKKSQAPDIHFTGEGLRDINSVRQSMALLYEEKSELSFKVSPEANANTGDFQFNLNYLKELPIIDTTEPVGLNTKFTEITKDNSNELGNSFKQFIPYRANGKNVKSGTWNFEIIGGTSILNESSWEVWTKNNVNVTNLFIANSDGSLSLIEGNQTVLSNEVLTFKRKSEFNGKVVNKNELDKNNYLNQTGNILAEIDGKQRNGNEKFVTSINMKAELTISFKEEISKDPIKQSKKQGLLITEKVPSPDVIEGYSYRESVPADLTAMKFSKDEITYLYKMELAADKQKGKLFIGQKNEDIDFSIFVKNVRSGSKVLNKDEYKVELSDTSKIPDVVILPETPEEIEVVVSLISNPNIKILVKSEVYLEWGNTIAFGGDEVGGRLGGGAYALHNGKVGGKPYISAVSGAKTVNDNKPIAPNYTSDYLDFGVFNTPSSSDIISFTGDSRPSSPRVTAKGTELKQDVLNRWNTPQDVTQSVNYGDIAFSSSVEPKKNYMTGKYWEFPVSLDGNQQNVFYEITNEGYRLLEFNRIEMVENPAVMYGTSKEELDKKAQNGEFIKLKKPVTIDTVQARIIGFKEGHYPNTTKANTYKDSIIIIEQSLVTNNKKIHYEVPIEMYIADGDLSFESSDNLSFGQNILPTNDTFYVPLEENHKVVVNDTRQEPKKWNLKARMEKPLQYEEGQNVYELTGSSIVLFGSNGKGDTTLTDTPKIIKQVPDNSGGKNVISWNNKTNEGYRLFVKQGTAKKNKKYQGTFIYSIDDSPEVKAVGK